MWWYDRLDIHKNEYLNGCMEISYRTKKESNAVQRREFLALDKGERFWRFLRLMNTSELLPRKSFNQKDGPHIRITTDRSMQEWNKEIQNFVRLASEHDVKMILVGGGAVNFHGYQRHSADVDFWIKTSPRNLSRLVSVFSKMGFEIKEFPKEVVKKQQNISVKFSPEDLRLELITEFSLDKNFDEVWQNCEEVETGKGASIFKWRVLSYDDLVESKLKSQRPKDMLDIQELERIRKL